VVTNGWSPYGDKLTNGIEVAVNSGDNRCGDVIAWEEIEPGGTSFSVVCRSYISRVGAGAPVPPTGTIQDTYGYAINAFLLEEIETAVRPVEIVQQPVGTNVISFRPFSLSVRAVGTAPQYQWYKVDAGGDIALPEATMPTYTVTNAQPVDTGDYYVIVQNSSNSVVSTNVHVEVTEDLTPPSVLTMVGSASFTEVTIHFSERMKADDAMLDPVNYSIEPGSLGVMSVRMANNDTVAVLTTDMQTPETEYTVTFYGSTDLAGWPVTPDTASFWSWVPNPYGGVVFQTFTNISSTSLSALTNHAKFPNQPDETFFLATNDTSLYYINDNYGGRMRSLFIRWFRVRTGYSCAPMTMASYGSIRTAWIRPEKSASPTSRTTAGPISPSARCRLRNRSS